MNKQCDASLRTPVIIYIYSLNMAYISLLYIRISISKHKSALMVSKTIPTIGRRNAHMKPFAIYVCIYTFALYQNKNNWRKTHAALVNSSKTSNAYAVRWPKNSIFTRIFMYPTNPFWDEKCRQQKLAKTSTYIYI